MENSVKVKSRADHFNCSLYGCEESFLRSRYKLGKIIQTGVVMDLEMLLASSCRRRILRVLSRSRWTNVMGLVRRVNSTYNQVNSNLQVLQKEGIVFDQRFGRTRMVSLNKENPKTALLLQALRILETATDDKPP